MTYDNKKNSGKISFFSLKTLDNGNRYCIIETYDTHKETKMNAQEIATRLGIKFQDGWYCVGAVIDIDGSPWVDEQTFLEIIEILGE